MGTASTLLRKSREKTIFCSFCRKSEHEVSRLIAGPACFICGECISRCNEVLVDAKDLPPHPPRIDWPKALPDDALLKFLGSQDKMYQELRERVQETVDILREREVSWNDIGAALGVSRQAAWERFS